MKYLLISLLLLSTASVEAHDAPTGWQYGQECCSGMDCFQDKDNNVRIAYDGYHIMNTGEIIPFNDKRIKHSQDEYYHRCTHFGKPDTKLICLYIPNQGM